MAVTPGARVLFAAIAASTRARNVAGHGHADVSLGLSLPDEEPHDLAVPSRQARVIVAIEVFDLAPGALGWFRMPMEPDHVRLPLTDIFGELHREGEAGQPKMRSGRDEGRNVGGLPDLITGWRRAQVERGGWVLGDKIVVEGPLEQGTQDAQRRMREVAAGVLEKRVAEARTRARVMAVAGTSPAHRSIRFSAAS